MASVQVMRKQEHLEAGKRRLEEFRKKKAAERAKKASSSSQQQASDVSSNEKQPLETENVRITGSEGAGTSDGPAREPLGVVINYEKSTIDYAQKSDHSSSNERSAYSSVIANDNNAFSADLVQTQVKDQGFKRYDASGFARPVNNDYNQEIKEMSDGFGVYSEVQRRVAFGSTDDQSLAIRTQSSLDIGSSSSQSSNYGPEESLSKENMSSLKDSTIKNLNHSNAFVTKISPQNSVGTLLQMGHSNGNMLASGRVSSSYYEDSIEPTTSVTGSAVEDGQNVNGKAEFNDSMISNLGERKHSNAASNFWSVDSAPVKKSEYFPTGFGSDIRSSSNHVPLYSSATETNTRRSRPSFLDSLNVSRASSASPFPHSEPEESYMSNSTNLNGMDVLGSFSSQNPPTESETTGPFSKLRTPNAPTSFEHPINSSFSASNGVDLRGPGVNTGRTSEFYSPNHNEDFSALEQHIEDLTQEKFSLQRALEASRALAESLAAENSSLTDSYNQQGSVVNQIKSDMENLQEEIKAQLVELESVKIEYANVQLECNAADERAKLLASEVIGLEEKALRLRSSELKLERQLENLNAELSSYKKKLSSLERERQDLQSTIDALQEEKKLMQSKLWKASSGGKSIDISKSLSKKDVSTSTEDLANEDTIPDTSNQEMHTTASILGSGASSSSLLPESGQLTLEVSSINIPHEHMRTIQNINELISELALEKEELMQAFASESAQSSRLKDLNKELSQKLEAQTQRLELLTAQSMANENIPARLPDSRTLPDHSAYADEGDEVVERVLGWIMKLFPGGPSRRRTSKLL